MEVKTTPSICAYGCLNGIELDRNTLTKNQGGYHRETKDQKQKTQHHIIIADPISSLIGSFTLTLRRGNGNRPILLPIILRS
jgi:hypothetical protein